MSGIKPDLFSDSKLPQTGTTIFSVMSALANQHEAINLSQGFPDFDGPQEIIDNVYAHMNAGKNQYAPMQGMPQLRIAIAEKFAGLYKMNLNPETEITVTAGATQAIFTFIMAAVQPGDEVILFAPAYDCYAPAIILAGGKPVFIPLREPGFSIPWEEVRKKFNHQTRLVIVNNPHNPCSSVLKDDDPERLASLVYGTKCLVLSDEVYEHIVFDDKKHFPLILHPGLKDRTFCVYSFGKTFHFTGWKMGYGIGSEKLSSEFRKVHQFNVFCVNTPVQLGFADYIAQSKEYLDLSTFYEKKRNLFMQGLEASRFKLKPASGSYFILADYAEISDLNDVEFANWLTVEHGVAAIPLSPFYPLNQKSDGKYVRFCFAKGDETLINATEKLCKI